MNIIKKETLILDPIDKYTHWLISKFTSIVKGIRFTPEQLEKIIIGKGMTTQKKEVFIEMLYNREVVLAWNFTEMGKVRRNVAPPQKIQIVDHKTLRVSGFQIPKALTSTIIDILQKRLKIGVIELCHGLYQNLWYLVKKSTPEKYWLINIIVELNRIII